MKKKKILVRLLLLLTIIFIPTYIFFLQKPTILIQGMGAYQPVEKKESNVSAHILVEKVTNRAKILEGGYVPGLTTDGIEIYSGFMVSLGTNTEENEELSLPVLLEEGQGYNIYFKVSDYDMESLMDHIREHGIHLKFNNYELVVIN